MTDKLLRKIPAVDVKLDDSMCVPIHHSYNSKDFMPRVFGREQTLTTHSSEYQKGVDNYDSPSSKKNSERPAPKYLIQGVEEITTPIAITGTGSSKVKKRTGSVSSFSTTGGKSSALPSLILLHNAMILRPKRFKMRNAMTVGGVVLSGGSKTAAFDAGIAGVPLQGSYTTDTLADNKSIYEYIVAGFEDKTSKTSGTEIFIEQNKRNRTESWIVKNKLPGKPGSVKGADLMRDLTSVFKLRKNQPFFIKCRLHRMPEKFRAFARSSPEWKKNTQYSAFLPDDGGEYTSLLLEFGTKEGGAAGSTLQDGSDSFKLVIKGGGSTSLALFKWAAADGWKQYGQVMSLPMESGKKESHESDISNLTIYPMGRFLIVSSGLPSTENTMKQRYVVWEFDRLISIPEGKLKVGFYGGKAEFSFNPIIHVKEGKLISPPVGIGFDPEFFFMKVDYEGKFRSDYVGEKNSTSKIKLPIPTPEDIAGAAQSKDKKKGDSGSAKTKKTPYFQYLKDFVFLEKQFLTEKGGADADEKKFFKNNQNKSKKNQIKYVLTLKSHDTEVRRIYSPIVYKVEMHCLPRVAVVKLSPNPQIDNADVKLIEISQGVQEISASVTLWNRFDCEKSRKEKSGPYTFGLQKPKGNFTGVKPITIRGGISSGNRKPGAGNAPPGLGNVDLGEIPDKSQPIQMRGFISQRNYSRPSSAESYCELTIEDVSKQAKEQFAVNLPIYDGWCNLAVIYSLAKEAGYKDDQILFYQDPRNENDKITIKEMMEAAGTDVDGRKNGCFAGHVPKFPQNIGPAQRVSSLPPSTVHALMPLNAYREQPAYMFQMGRSLWECMQEIREFTGFFMFPNIFGNIVYAPAEVALGVKSKKTPKAQWNYYEISGGSPGGATDYSQYQGALSVPFGTDHVRNAVMTFALIPASTKPKFPMVDYAPVVIIKKQPKWPFNTSDPSYVPWLKWLIVRSPHWNDLGRAKANTEQRFLRGIMPRTTPSFGSWGHALVYPYDIIKLDESEAGETGIDQTSVIVQSVTKTFDAERKSFGMELACEYVDFTKFEWSPHENQAGPVHWIQR